MTDEIKIEPAETHAGKAWKHARPLIACRFDPSGKYVFTGAEDNLVTRWDLAADEKAPGVPLAAHDSWVRAIGFSPSGDTVYTGGYDGRLIWWPAAAEKPEPIRKIEPAHQGWIRALAVSPDGTRLATCGNDKLVKLWDPADGRLVADLTGHQSHVYNVAFHPTDGTLVSCDLKGGVKEWDVAAAAPKRDLSAAAALYKYDTQFRADIGGARSIAFRADGKELALGGITNVTNAFAGIGNPAVVVFDLGTGQPAMQLEGKEKINGTIWGVASHPDGFWIGLSGGGGGGWLYFWKAPPSAEPSPAAEKPAAEKPAADKAATDKPADKPAEKGSAEFHKLKLAGTGRDLALSPDARQLAVAHADHHLRLYSLHKKPA